LIGRDFDLQAVVARLHAPATRLLTLVGGPGIGKTRLAIQAATEVLDAFPDGAFFVALASTADPALVLTTIAHALQVRESARRTIGQALTDVLRDRHALLVLDNFEHLLPAAPIVGELLASAPALKVLATSREPLEIYGEHCIVVPPLRLPAKGPLPPLEELARTPAVELFITRAGAAQPGFCLVAGNAAEIAEICRRLDGVPLAIELAAARNRGMSPHALLAHLTAVGPVRLLDRGPRDVPERQQTLRDAIGWSYALLAPAEQGLFRRLGVFAGGCTEDAAVAGASTEPADSLRLLESLMNKSLIQEDWGPNDERRYVLLESIREFAAEQLEAEGEAEMVREWHARYYLALAEAAQPHVEGPQPAAWLDRLEAERANLRAAFGWFLRDGPHGAVEAARRLSWALSRAWDARNRWHELQWWQDRWRRVLLDPADPAPCTAATAAALSDAAALTAYLGPEDAARARVFEEAALGIRRALGDDRGAARSLRTLGEAARLCRDAAAARRYFEESLARYQAIDDTAGAASALRALGRVALEGGERDTAAAHLEDGLELARKAGAVATAAECLRWLSRLALDRGDTATARVRQEEALETWREAGDRAQIAHALNQLGELERACGAYDRAAVWFEQRLAITRELRNASGTASALQNLGHVTLRRGDAGRAAAVFREVVDLMRPKNGAVETSDAYDAQLVGLALAGLAGVAAAGRRWERGARLLGAAGALLEAADARLGATDQTDLDRYRDAIRAALGEQKFAVARAEGRAMSVEQAISSALDG
jgi:predicted ATPase